MIRIFTSLQTWRALGFSALLIVLTCWGAVEQAEDHLKRGLRLMRESRLEPAIASFTDAIRLDPQYSTAYLNRGKAFLNQGVEKKALADLTTAIRLEPSARAYAYRGWAYNVDGQYADAIADCEEALRLDPEDAAAYWTRGTARFKRGEFDPAMADFNAAVKYDPKFALAFRNRGVLYLRQREYEKAIADFTEAIRLNHSDARSHRHRAVTHSQIGDYEQALEDLRSSLRIDSNDVEAYNDFAWLLATCPHRRWRDGAKALEHATKAAEITDWQDAGILDTLAAAYAETNQFDRAVEWMRKAIAGTPQRQQPGLLDRLRLYQAGMPYRMTDPGANE